MSQSAEVAELDELHFVGMLVGEVVEGFIQRNQLVGRIVDGEFQLVEIDAIELATALNRPRLRALSTRMRRMASAAAAKKCQRLSQSCTLLVSTRRR